MLAEEKRISAESEATKSKQNVRTLTLFVMVWRPEQTSSDCWPPDLQGHQTEDYEVRQCITPAVGDRHQDGSGVSWIVTARQTYLPTTPGHWLTVTIAVCTTDGDPVRRQDYDDPSDRLTIHLADDYELGLLSSAEPLPSYAQLFQCSGDRQPGNTWEIAVLDHNH